MVRILLALSAALALAFTTGAASARSIVGMGIDGTNNFVFVWYDDGTVTAGSSNSLSSKRTSYRYTLPPGKTYRDIVGMGIDGGNDFVFAWYRDGTVSAGTSDDLDKRRRPYRYSLPPGKTVSDIVGMGIDGRKNNVLAWYRDGTVSMGTSADLDSKRSPYSFDLPDMRSPSAIHGMAIDGYVLGRDGQKEWRSLFGEVVDQKFVDAGKRVLGIAFDGTGAMSFAWYGDGKVSAGKSVDLAKVRKPYSFSR